jgi:O-antigen/teichoic acid export membrane protein
MPAAAGLSILAAPIILLLYGSAFAPAAGVLAIIAWDIPFRLYNAFAGNVSNATNMEQKAWRIFMTGAVIGVIAYVPAIYFYGMYGAAVVTVASDMITTTLFLVLMHNTLRAVKGGVLLRVLLAAAAMSFMVYYIEPKTGLLLGIVIGVALYGLLCLLLGLIDRETIRRVGALISSRRKK